jgi:hypothetical protein
LHASQDQEHNFNKHESFKIKGVVMASAILIGSGDRLTKHMPIEDTSSWERQTQGSFAKSVARQVF